MNNIEQTPRLEKSETLEKDKREEIRALIAEQQAIIDNINFYNQNGTRQDASDRNNLEQAELIIEALRSVESVISFDSADHQAAFEEVHNRIATLEEERAKLPLADNRGQDKLRRQRRGLEKTAEYMKQFLNLKLN